MRIPEKKLQHPLPTFSLLLLPRQVAFGGRNGKERGGKKGTARREVQVPGRGGSGGQLAPIPNLRRGAGEGRQQPGAARACAPAAPGGRGAERGKEEGRGAEPGPARRPGPAEPRPRRAEPSRGAAPYPPPPLMELRARLPPRFCEGSGLDSPGSPHTWPGAFIRGRGRT